MLDKAMKGEKRIEQRNCKKHGFYASTNFIGDYWTDCPSCMAIKRKEVESKKKKSSKHLQRNVSNAGGWSK